MPCVVLCSMPSPKHPEALGPSSPWILEACRRPKSYQTTAVIVVVRRIRRVKKNDKRFTIFGRSVADSSEGDLPPPASSREPRSTGFAYDDVIAGAPFRGYVDIYFHLNVYNCNCMLFIDGDGRHFAGGEHLMKFAIRCAEIL